jgi:acyl carrier protein
MKTLEEQVVAVLTDELRYKDGIIELSMNLKEDLDVQSLDALELLIALEDKFRVVYPADSHEHIKTVQDVIDLTKKLLK